MRHCSVCNVNIDNHRWYGHLRSNVHKSNNTTSSGGNVEIINTSFKGRIVSYKFKADSHDKNHLPELFLHNISRQVKQIITKTLQKHTSIKVNFVLFSFFLMFKNDRQEMKSFSTKNVIITLNFDFQTFYKRSIEIMLKRIDSFLERDSGWSFLCNSHLELNINKYQPLSGSKFIALPKFIQNKKACLNIQNNDKFCFLWSVVAGLYPKNQNQHRTSSYPHFQNVLNINNLSFPITFSDIAVFEKNNSFLNIFVYGLRNNKTIIGPLYKSINNKGKSIHLLLLENNSNTHYCLIKDLPRLVRSQITQHHGKLYFCESCLLFFPTSHEIDTHLCGGVVTVLPNRGSYLSFKNFNRKQNIPFVIYADFETLLAPVTDTSMNTSITSYSQQHVPAAFGYNIVSQSKQNIEGYRCYRGIDCVSKYVSFLIEDVKAIYKCLSKIKPMIFTEKDAENFRNASTNITNKQT